MADPEGLPDWLQACSAAASPTRTLSTTATRLWAVAVHDDLKRGSCRATAAHRRGDVCHDGRQRGGHYRWRSSCTSPRTPPRERVGRTPTRPRWAARGAGGAARRDAHVLLHAHAEGLRVALRSPQLTTRAARARTTWAGGGADAPARPPRRVSHAAAARRRASCQSGTLGRALYTGAEPRSARASARGPSCSHSAARGGAATDTERYVSARPPPLPEGAGCGCDPARRPRRARASRASPAR